MNAPHFDFSLSLDLKKRPVKTILNITDKDLLNNKEKVLEVLKKECVDVKSWFYIILYYYSIEDYKSFKLFSDELTKINIYEDLKSSNETAYFKEQEKLFIHILNILSFFYSFISEKCKDKGSYENYSGLSTSLINQAEQITVFGEMILISKGFLFFIKNDFEQSDVYFSVLSDNAENLSKNIVILSKLGRALNAYNKANYQKAIEFFVCLIKDFNYCNENILECLGICYYNDNKIDKAKGIFEKVLEYYPNNYKIRTYLSVIELLDLDNTEKFRDNFNKLLNAFELNKYSDLSLPSLLINLCNILLIDKEYNLAKNLIDKLNNQLEYSEIKFSTNQNNKNLNTNTSYYYPNSKKKEKNYRRDYSEIKSAIYTINAKYYLCMNKKEEALSFFLRAVQENSNNIEARYGLGQIYLASMSFVEAEKCFEICKNLLDEMKMNSFKVLKYLAFIYSKTKRKEIEKAIDLYQQAIALKDDDIDCYVELAELMNLMNPKESIFYYKQAVRLIKEKKEKIDAYNNTNNNNNLNIEPPLYDESTLYNEKIVPELLNNLACTLIRINKLDEVEKYLNEAKEIVKKRLDEYKDQKDKSELLIRMDSLYLSIEFNYVLYYEKLSQYDMAHQICKKILSLNPYFTDAYIKLGELAKMRGNYSKANDYLKLAIEKNFIEEKSKQSDKKEDPQNTNKDSTEQNAQPISENNNTNIQNSNNALQSSVENNKQNQVDSQKAKMKRLISLMNKPINPLILQAYLYYETDKEQESIQTLNSILRHYDGKDPYTLILLANIYYNLAIKSRNEIDNEKLNRAVELYYRALELDKYNSLAAIGICNCLCEYNYVDKALEIYKSTSDVFENNPNAFINESILYMNQGKFEKGSVILNKVLTKLFDNKNPNIENLLAKCYIETKEFDKANHLLKNLMMTYPDNLVYKFNYGTLLISKSNEILSKTERKVCETKEAINYLEKSIKLFEILIQMKRDEKIIKLREFYYKCSDVINICKANLSMAKESLKKDITREEEMNLKNKLQMEQYQKMVIEAINSEKKEEINEELIKERNERNERNKAILEEIMKQVPIVVTKGKKTKKNTSQINNELDEQISQEEERKPKKRGRKKKNEDDFVDKEEEEEYEDEEEYDEGENEPDLGEDNEENDREEKKHSHKHKHHHDKDHEHHHHHLHKRKRSDQEDVDVLLNKDDEGDKKTKKILRKKQRLDDEGDLNKDFEDVFGENEENENGNENENEHGNEGGIIGDENVGLNNIQNDDHENQGEGI